MSLNPVWWCFDVRWRLNKFSNRRRIRRSKPPIVTTIADNRAPTCQIRKSVIDVSQSARLRSNRTRQFVICRCPKATLADDLFSRVHELTTLECLWSESLVRNFDHQVCQFGRINCHRKCVSELNRHSRIRHSEFSSRHRQFIKNLLDDVLARLFLSFSFVGDGHTVT